MCDALPCGCGVAIEFAVFSVPHTHGLSRGMADGRSATATSNAATFCRHERSSQSALHRQQKGCFECYATRGDAMRCDEMR
jgi:hypothetical protein